MTRPQNNDVETVLLSQFSAAVPAPESGLFDGSPSPFYLPLPVRVWRTGALTLPLAGERPQCTECPSRGVSADRIQGTGAMAVLGSLDILASGTASP
ncbi:unnamed protein product [Rangifer tarandus platyrhynchus]|uniref:Uncharacterized protein n=1 Tax=Rangifer tarandus platyrhynchus TaxID=3082113 RepID=A0AC59YAY6_RANTA